MECDAALRHMPGQQCGDVTVADEHLGIGRDPAWIERRQQLLAAITAAHGDDAAD